MKSRLQANLANPSSTVWQPIRVLGLIQAGVILLLTAGCDPDVADQPAGKSDPQPAQVAEPESPPASNPVTVETEKTVESGDLNAMVKLFHQHIDAKGKGPSSWDSFITWAQAEDATAAATLEKLKARGVTFFCEQDIRKATNGTSNTIFAYCDQVPSDGGLVAFMDGSVTSVTAEEFKQKLDMQKQLAPSNAAKLSN